MGPPPSAMAPGVAAGLDPGLVRQVMALTPAQISSLPPDKQQSIMALRNQITGGGMRYRHEAFVALLHAPASPRVGDEPGVGLFSRVQRCQDHARDRQVPGRQFLEAPKPARERPVAKPAFRLPAEPDLQGPNVRQERQVQLRHPGQGRRRVSVRNEKRI
ncbi:hypothetical protein THAOC_25067 [Thalassiosira oceanica]|uniref:Transcription termination and cleavage factor C-terminal domain-containing protein n=1 Tax=Thalassiosira oceanica TaxID=159749 RepID=K0RQ99_THAOC|nr:hypothetical protein THAOC_25067 [Thalassiosira oceanica]|eukprot:EJK55225.1 hypothetical protein THAOC_25067 [Thalassiosira oceanica]